MGLGIQAQSRYAQLLFNPKHITFLSFPILQPKNSMLQCWENGAKSCQKPGLCRLLAFCLLTHSIQGTLCRCRWGLREEVTVPSSWGKEKASPPPSTSCNVPCTKVIHHYRLDRSSVHSTALCHASLIDTMPKMTSFNSSLVNRRVCNSEAELRFFICVKFAFLLWRNIFNAAFNSPSVLFSYFCSDFCEDKGKLQADWLAFQGLKETSKLWLKEEKYGLAKYGKDVHHNHINQEIHGNEPWEIHTPAPMENKIQSPAGQSKQAQSNFIQRLHIDRLFTQYPTEHNLVELYRLLLHTSLLLSFSRHSQL